MDQQQINLKQTQGNTGAAQSGAQVAGVTAAQAAGVATTAQATGQGASTAAAIVIDHANNPALPEKVRGYWKEVEAKYVIPRLVREKYPQLIQLIKETESMNDEEREYWFQILPIMTEEQIKKFVGILDNEKQQLQKLDTEYESEISKLNDKHNVEWDAFEAKKKRDEIKQQEKVAEAAENKTEENLLNQLSSL